MQPDRQTATGPGLLEETSSSLATSAAPPTPAALKPKGGGFRLADWGHAVVRPADALSIASVSAWQSGRWFQRPLSAAPRP